MDEPARTRVFISYSNDSAEDRERVRRLADRLISNGVDCVIDLDEPNPPEGWWAWLDRQLTDADFVLVVCTEGYFQKAMAGRQASGHGAKFESVIVVQALYDSGMRNEKFVPVLFEDLPTEKILSPLRPYTRYRLDNDVEYTKLLRYLTAQPQRIRPPLGKVPQLPPDNAGKVEAPIVRATPSQEGPRTPAEASSSFPVAPSFDLTRRGLLRRVWEALVRGPLLRRRFYLPAAALTLLAAFGFGAARWLCMARDGALVPVFSSSLISTFCAPEELYAKAVTSWENLDTRSSRQLFEKAIAKRPDYWLAYSGLAVLLHELGRDDLAAAKAKLACENAGGLSREERLLVIARCSYVERRWDDASKTYEELHHSFPDRLEYGLGLVKALDAAGRFGDALEAARSLLAQPSLVAHAARLHLAEAEAAYYLSDTKRMAQAAARAERDSQRWGDDHLRARAWFLEGVALLDHDPENALAALEKAEAFYARTTDRPNRAHALDAAAEVLLQQGRLSEARAKTDEALEIFQEVGDRDGQARQYLRQAIVDFEQGNVAEAETRFAAAIRDFRLAGNQQEEARFTSNLGSVLGRLGHQVEAVRYYERALSLYRDLGDRNGEATQLLNLTDSSMDELSLREAETRLARAKELATAIGSQDLIANALFREGDVADARGQLDVAGGKYRDAQARSASIGNTIGVAEDDLALAELELEQCENTLAQSDARKALGQFHREQVKDKEARAGAVLVVALVAGGSLPEAGSELEKAALLAKKSRDPDVEIAVALAGGRLRAAAGRPDEALRDLVATLERAHRAGLGRRAMQVRLALGEIEAARGEHKRAVEVLTSLEAMARSHGFTGVADRAARLRAGAPAGACSPT